MAHAAVGKKDTVVCAVFCKVLIISVFAGRNAISPVMERRKEEWKRSDAGKSDFTGQFFTP